jgi:LEA14-like dessication related protein
MNKGAKVLLSVLALAGTVAVGYGLYGFVLKQIKGAMNFCYKIANVKFVAISANLVSFVLDIKLLQNSDFRLQINNYFLNIAINGKVVASVKSSKTIDVLPKAVTYLSANVSFNPSNLFDMDYVLGLLSTAVTDQKNFIIEISGSVDVSVNFLHFPLPIKIKMTLADIMAPSPVDPKKDKQMVCKIY